MSVKSGKCIKNGAMIKVLEYGAVQRGNVFLVGDTIIINLLDKLTYGSGPAVDHAAEVILGLTGFYDDAKQVIVVPVSQYRGEVYLGNGNRLSTHLEGQSLVPPTRILIDFHGGAIHDVKADHPAEVLFISNHSDDVAEFIEDPKPALVPVSEDMADPHAWWHHTADISREDVGHYFDQLKDI